MSEKNHTKWRTLDLGQRSSEECEGFEEFWSERREKLLIEIEGNEWEIVRHLYIEKS